MIHQNAQLFAHLCFLYQVIPLLARIGVFQEGLMLSVQFEVTLKIKSLVYPKNTSFYCHPDHKVSLKDFFQLPPVHSRVCCGQTIQSTDKRRLLKQHFEEKSSIL